MTAIAERTLAFDWLRPRSFDAAFVLGVPAVALGAGALVAGDPRLFAPLLLLDLWLLGQHHVVATCTRLCFDRESFAKHRALVVALPVAVAVCVLATVATVGLWALTTVYLYWQWFHYARQSWGIARHYERRAGTGPAAPPWLEQLAFYGVPVWGILSRSHEAPAQFLGQRLVTLPVPAALVDAAGVVALLALAAWLVFALRAWRGRRLSSAYATYLGTHFAIFGTGYLWMDSIDHGWLVVNVWHNAQYILFVWRANTKRFPNGEDPAARWLSRLCQPGRLPLYLAICFGISTALYLSIELAVASAAAAIVVQQIINYHHYVVDAIIWRSPRPRSAA